MTKMAKILLLANSGRTKVLLKALFCLNSLVSIIKI